MINTRLSVAISEKLFLNLNRLHTKFIETYFCRRKTFIPIITTNPRVRTMIFTWIKVFNAATRHTGICNKQMELILKGCRYFLINTLQCKHTATHQEYTPLHSKMYTEY